MPDATCARCLGLTVVQRVYSHAKLCFPFAEALYIADWLLIWHQIASVGWRSCHFGLVRTNPAVIDDPLRHLELVSTFGIRRKVDAAYLSIL